MVKKSWQERVKKHSKPKDTTIFHEAWEERKNLYLREQQGDKAERKAKAMLIRKRTEIKDSLNRVLLVRYIFDSMPGKTFEEKKKNYEKFKQSSNLLEFNKETGEIKKSWFGLPSFVGIRGNKAKTSLRRVEKMAGIEPLDIRVLKDLKDIEKQRGIEKINKLTKNVLSKLEALNIVKLRRRQNKIVGVEIINSRAYDKMLETKRVPWPELPALKKKKEES